MSGREYEILGDNCPNAALFTIDPTVFDPGSNPGRRGWKPETNSLSYGTTTTKRHNEAVKFIPIS
jgi:hypothetical protein